MSPAGFFTRKTDPSCSSSRHDTRAYNVVIFGETGVGKSSLINLITGLHRAKTSSDVDACTERNQDYEVTIADRKFKIWDTAGLDGATFNRIHAVIAERNLKCFLSKLHKKGELDLLVYCVRGSRATHALVRNYKTFYSSVCKRSVPVVVIATCLENVHGEMDSWWQRNVGDLGRLGMVFAGHACVTTVADDPGDTAALRARRESSRRAVRDLIAGNCRPHELQSGNNPPTTNPVGPSVRNAVRSRNPASFLLSIISRRP